MVMLQQENLVKHLDFVQAIISRMASHSFFLKGGTVTLSTALFALAAKDANLFWGFIALFPALAFWGLDAYYLRQERMFRRLYDDVRVNSQKIAEVQGEFSLSTLKYRAEVASWPKTLISPSVIGLHGPVLGTGLAVVLAIGLIG